MKGPKKKSQSRKQRAREYDVAASAPAKVDRAAADAAEVAMESGATDDEIQRAAAEAAEDAVESAVVDTPPPTATGVVTTTGRTFRGYMTTRRGQVVALTEVEGVARRLEVVWPLGRVPTEMEFRGWAYDIDARDRRERGQISTKGERKVAEKPDPVMVDLGAAPAAPAKSPGARTARPAR
jgi:hypothetical protein